MIPVTVHSISMLKISVTSSEEHLKGLEATHETMICSRGISL